MTGTCCTLWDDLERAAPIWMRRCSRCTHLVDFVICQLADHWPPPIPTAPCTKSIIRLTITTARKETRVRLAEETSKVMLTMQAWGMTLKHAKRLAQQQLPTALECMTSVHQDVAGKPRLTHRLSVRRLPFNDLPWHFPLGVGVMRLACRFIDRLHCVRLSTARHDTPQPAQQAWKSLSSLTAARVSQVHHQALEAIPEEVLMILQGQWLA